MPIPLQQVVSENRRIFTPVRICSCCLEEQWPETVKRPLVGRIVHLNAAERGLEHGLQTHDGLESACFHVLAVWLWPNYLTFLCFRSLTGMSVMSPPPNEQFIEYLQYARHGAEVFHIHYLIDFLTLCSK